MSNIPEWTEGICGDGAAILRDGVMVPVENVVAALNLLSEALDLCVRARKLDEATARPGDDPLMPRSASPALWVMEQYDNDLAAWEAKARAALMGPLD